MSRFTIRECYQCGEHEFEDKMLNYNDHYYCSLNCRLKKEREDDKNLAYRSNVVRFNER